MTDLAHFGVKGMHWGQHTAQSPASQRDARVKKLESQINKLDMNVALAGIGLKGHYAQKLAKKETRKDPNFDVKAKKFTTEQNRAYSKKVSGIAKRRTLLNGIAATTFVLAAGNIAVNSLAHSPNAIRQGRIGAASLALIPMKDTYSNFKSIVVADKREAILNEIGDLKSQKRNTIRAR